MHDCASIKAICCTVSGTSLSFENLARGPPADAGGTDSRRFFKGSQMDARDPEAAGDLVSFACFHTWLCLPLRSFPQLRECWLNRPIPNQSGVTEYTACRSR